MVLDSWNVDMSNDITGARDYFWKLALFDNHIQIVGNIATNSMKWIKITQQGYSPPVDLG